jgi:hypothetical protein
MEPLTVNPGGELASDQVVGRDREIERYWQILSRQGLILAAERRIGKTSIVRKMHEDGRDGFLTVYQDLEHVHSLPELIRSVYASADEHFTKLSRIKSILAQWSPLLPIKVGEIEVPRAQDNWKPLLEQAVLDILEATPAEQKLVLIWDEFPLMLYNLRRGSPAAAIQLLDVLRGLRQRHGKRLRFVFTGSVGLHLILKSLRNQGNAANPVNDMYQETVNLMAEPDAVMLAERLLLSLGRPCPQRAQVARAVYQHVGGFPYFIHYVVDKLGSLGEITPDAVQDTVDDLIFNDADPLDFRHWSERLHLYYDQQDAVLARAIIRELAHSDDGLTFAELANRVRHQAPEVTDHALHSVCVLLGQDHYLQTRLDPRGTVYDFRWVLVKRWWRRKQP